jgi:integrase
VSVLRPTGSACNPDLQAFILPYPLLIFRPINQWGHIGETRLTDQSVRHILQDSLLRAGIRPSGFSGHSLRAGFATVAAMNGATEHEIQRTTGHVSLEVLRRYIRDGELFKKNAGRKLGL